MYTWHDSTFPISPIDNQTYVNHKDEIYRYDTVSGSWLLYKTAKLKKIKSIEIKNKGSIIKPSSFLIGWLEFGGDYKDKWNALFSKSYVKITYYNKSSVEYLYVAQATADELTTVYINSTPDPEKYPSFTILDIYEIIDENLHVNISGHNSLYAMARGRNCYYSKSQRRKYGYDGNQEPAPSFFGWGDFYDSDLGSKVLQEFFPDKPTPLNTTNQNKCIWFTAGKKLYQQPKVNSVVNSYHRTYYNFTSRTFVSASVINFYVGTPKFFGRRVSQSGYWTRFFLPMNKLRGNKIITEGYSGVLIYPLYAEDKSGVAFLMKPLGIDSVKLYLPIKDTGASFFSIVNGVNKYSYPYPIVTIQTYTLEGIDAIFTTYEHDSIYPFYRFRGSKGYNRNMPTRIQFMIRYSNGVVGYSKGYITINKKKVNAEAYFDIKKVEL